MNDDFLSKHRIDEIATNSRPTDNIPRKSHIPPLPGGARVSGRRPHVSRRNAAR